MREGWAIFRRLRWDGPELTIGCACRRQVGSRRRARDWGYGPSVDFGASDIEDGDARLEIQSDLPLLILVLYLKQRILTQVGRRLGDRSLLALQQNTQVVRLFARTLRQRIRFGIKMRP